MDAVDPLNSFIPDEKELAYDPNLASEMALQGRASAFMCRNCKCSYVFRRIWELCDKDAPYSSTPVWCENCHAGGEMTPLPQRPPHRSVHKLSCIYTPHAKEGHKYMAILEKGGNAPLR